MSRKTLDINGQARVVDIDPATPLLWVLRDELNLKGSKFGCGMGLCGACTVHLDGRPIRSCVTPVGGLAGKITTIEGVGATAAGARVQKAWVEIDVVQCGYCQAGQIMSATALLTENPKPTEEDILAAMEGNICRCGTYPRIVEAIKAASKS